MFSKEKSTVVVMRLFGDVAASPYDMGQTESKLKEYALIADKAYDIKKIYNTVKNIHIVKSRKQEKSENDCRR